jgi:hypothetical protein
MDGQATPAEGTGFRRVDCDQPVIDAVRAQGRRCGSSRISWPDGKRFAFSIFDDTDRAALDNVPHVYRLLRDLGFRTTKTVWPIGGTQPPAVAGGLTCEDAAYLSWVKELASEGFEIALHNVTYHGSERDDIKRGLDRFAELFGRHPASMANHTECEDGMYWGAARVSGIRNRIYRLATARRPARYFGHVPGSPHFWGDLCRDRIKYVRNFTFADLDTLKACPFMPYHDRDRPFVRAWFAASEGGLRSVFNETLTERAQDRLAEEGGASIVYTHFGKTFVTDGAVDRRFADLMRRLSRLGGWFVPVSRLLDYIAEQRGIHEITKKERAHLEWRWLRHKMAMPQS